MVTKHRSARCFLILILDTLWFSVEKHSLCNGCVQDFIEEKRIFQIFKVSHLKCALMIWILGTIILSSAEGLIYGYSLSVLFFEWVLQHFKFSQYCLIFFFLYAHSTLKLTFPHLFPFYLSMHFLLSVSFFKIFLTFNIIACNVPVFL